MFMRVFASPAGENHLKKNLHASGGAKCTLSTYAPSWLRNGPSWACCTSQALYHSPTNAGRCNACPGAFGRERFAHGRDANHPTPGDDACPHPPAADGTELSRPGEGGSVSKPAHDARAMAMLPPGKSTQRKPRPGVQKPRPKKWLTPESRVRLRIPLPVEMLDTRRAVSTFPPATATTAAKPKRTLCPGVSRSCGASPFATPAPSHVLHRASREPSPALIAVRCRPCFASSDNKSKMCVLRLPRVLSPAPPLRTGCGPSCLRCLAAPPHAPALRRAAARLVPSCQLAPARPTHRRPRFAALRRLARVRAWHSAEASFGAGACGPSPGCAPGGRLRVLAGRVASGSGARTSVRCSTAQGAPAFGGLRAPLRYAPVRSGLASPGLRSLRSLLLATLRVSKAKAPTPRLIAFRAGGLHRLACSMGRAVKTHPPFRIGTAGVHVDTKLVSSVQISWTPLRPQRYAVFTVTRWPLPTSYM